MSEPTAVDALLFHTGFSEVTPTDLAQYLKRTFTADETASASEIITAVEYDLASKCHRNFNTDLTYYEYFSGGHSLYRPKNYPVKTLSKIVIEGTDVTANYVLNTDYWLLRSDIKFYTPLYFTRMPYNAVRLEYTITQFWGEDVTLLIKKWAGVNFLNAENGGVPLANFSFEGLSQAYSYTQFTAERDALIAHYEDVVV